MNDMFQELKREIDYQECEVELVDDIECPVGISIAEISIDNNGRLDAKKLKEEQKRKEKTELQKLKKQWEDR